MTPREAELTRQLEVALSALSGMEALRRENQLLRQKLDQIVVSARKRAAKTTFNGSALGRVLISASGHRPRFNSSAMMSSASASAVSARSSP